MFIRLIMMSLKDSPHFAVGLGCNLARLYYRDKQFVCILMDHEMYCPYFTPKLNEMSDYLLELFEKSGGTIDWQLNHP